MVKAIDNEKLRLKLGEYIETNQRLKDLLINANVSVYKKIALMLDENIEITRRLEDELNKKKYDTPEGLKRLIKISIDEARQWAKIEEALDEYHYHR